MKCSKCGEEHDPDDLELGFDQPDMFFEMPLGDRENRAQCNDDLCEIDGKHFFIRGFLEIPRTDSPLTFAFGVWAKVTHKDYKRYLELYRDERQAEELPFVGQLANQIPGYPKTIGLKTQVQMISPESRPALKLISNSHPMAKDQKQGITGARVLEILRPHIH